MTAATSQPTPLAATRSTIRRKLVGVVLAAVATTTLLAAVASSWREAARYADAKRAEIRGTAFVFSAAVAEPLSQGDRISVLRALRAIGQIPSFEHARVEDAEGRTVAELGAAVALEESSDLPILLRSTLDVHVPIKKAGATIGRLTVLANTSDLRDRLLDGLVTNLLAALFAAGVGVVIALKLQKRITDPLRRLTRSMVAVRNTNDFSRNVDFSSDDETGVLVDAFNGMMTEIRQRDDRLARHRENLEKTVEERTFDLREAKDAAEEANAAKSDFLATMSHEIRTPMNGVLVMAELLASAELTDRHRRYADVVVKSGQSLLAIINDILDFSKIESGKMDLEQVALDPAELVDDVLNLFWERASGKGLDLSAYVAPEVPDLIAGDPVRLNQILSNLVNNALKFTKSGHVSVAVGYLGREPDCDKVKLEFAVSDTGIGIPQDKLDTIFESFSQADQSTTREFGGTGLGLAICKRLVGAMGGVIEVSSVPGAGSEFRFTMLTADLSEPAETDRPAAANPLRAAMIALSGDATAGAITSYLEDRGIRATHIAPSDFVADGARCVDVVFAEPDIVGRIPASPLGHVLPSPLVVCVTQMGDTRSDEAIETGAAHDLLMRPISRTTLNALLDRLEAGKPRGRDALKRSSGAETPRFPGAKALVADDSPVNREVVIEALKQLAVRADVVEDGREAVEHASSRTYDIVFMDCSMPVMDGFAATRQIRAAESAAGVRPVPIVALTAHVAGGAADAWRDAGMDAYLSKPFRLTDLAACFEKFVHPPPSHSVAPAEIAPYAARRSRAPAAPPEPAPFQAAERPALAVIDEGVLATVAACSPGDGRELVLRVLGLFESHAPKTLLTLAEAAQGEANGAIADAAHALKSMARNIGAERLAQACGTLEAEARAGDVTGLKTQLLTIRTEVLDVLADITARKSDGENARQSAS